MIEILVPGDVIPAARPRMTRNGHAYQPKRNAEYRRLVQASAMAAMKNSAPMTGRICAAVKVYRRYRAESRRFGDVDNLLKALFDGMNQIAFADDAQITKCTVEKISDAENPRAEIKLTKAIEK